MAPLATLFLALALQGPVDAAQQPARSRTMPRTAEAMAAADTAALRQAIDALTRQVALLRVQLGEQQATDLRRFNANVARLQLVLADQDRMKKARAEALGRLRGAQARADDMRERLANIQRELITSGELNRSAGEDRLRSSYNRQLDDATRDTNDAQQELYELDAKIEKSERIAETLRKRLRIDESQIDVDDTPPAPKPEPPPENP